MSLGGLEKLQNTAADLEGHMYTQSCVHAEKTWEDPKFSSLANTEALFKQEVKSVHPWKLWLAAVNSLAQHWTCAPTQTQSP